MKKCAYCDNEIQRTSPRANNVKFCSADCRQSHYRDSGKLKASSDKANHSRYNKYAKGKEQCVICDGWYWGVCYHATQRHGISEREYKKMIGADLGKGRLPAETKEKKKQHVFENGTVENLKKGAKYRYQKGQKGVGVYERSPETLARLKIIQKLSKRKS
jgi:hypothetical protein